MSKLKLIFAGSGEFGLPTLKALADQYEIVHVFSQPDRPAGRGRKLTPTPIAQFALDRGLPLTRTANINTETIPPADFMVVIAFGQKISREVIDAPRLSCINLHASILPKCRGAAPINWTILRGEKYAGNSIIRLADKMDAGAVLGQSKLEIGETETAGELHDRLSQDGVSLVLKVVEELATGRAIETPQDHSQATIAPKLSRANAQIDWSKPGTEIARTIHGLSPWPGCHVLLKGDGELRIKLTLLRVRALPIENSASSGMILADGTVAVSDGRLEILELQPEGKRPMKFSDFRNGHVWPAGATLESIV